MTTNQEGRQAAIRDSTSTAYGVAADWNALFDDAGISAGTFNERLLAWINDQLGTSYSNLLGAMAAYAADAGFNAWSSISTLVLGGASTLLSGETDGLAFDFTDSSARIKDTSTPANRYSSTGIVSNGSLVGPSGKLVYTSNSNKLTLQSDGFIKYQAHNLVTYSDLQTTGWTSGRLTISNNQAVNPLTGETTASKLTETTDNATHRAYSDAISVVSGAILSVSIYAKSGGAANNKLRVALKSAVEGDAGWDSRQGTSYFDLDSGVVGGTGGNSSGMTSTITSVGNGWYLCTVTASVNVTSCRMFLYSVNDAGSDSYTGDLGNYTFVSNAHVYRYPANTDYIKTTSAAKYALPLEYDTSGNCLGLLVEDARTNLCLYSNDLTQAGSWTASNMTTAKTATGPDNVANSATTITASAGNATILQAITSASAARVTSVYIKRRTGTGNIDLTQDNGSTWTTQAVDSTWTRFSLSSVTSANPTVGIRIVTSGDAVDVALFSHEIGTFVTSPIPTYGAAATRLEDKITMSISSTPLSGMTATGEVMSGFLEYLSRDTGETSFLLQVDSGGATNRAVIQNDASNRDYVFTVTSLTDTLTGTAQAVTDGEISYIAFRVAEDDGAFSVRGGTQQTDSAVDLFGSALTTIRIGHYVTANYQPNTPIRKIVLVPSSWSNATLEEKVGN